MSKHYTPEEVRQKALNWAARKLGTKTPDALALQVCKVVLACVHPKAGEPAEIRDVGIERLEKMRKAS